VQACCHRQNGRRVHLSGLNTITLPECLVMFAHAKENLGRPDQRSHQKKIPHARACRRRNRHRCLKKNITSFKATAFRQTGKRFFCRTSQPPLYSITAWLHGCPDQVTTLLNRKRLPQYDGKKIGRYCAIRARTRYEVSCLIAQTAQLSPAHVSTFFPSTQSSS